MDYLNNHPFCLLILPVVVLISICMAWLLSEKKIVIDIQNPSITDEELESVLATYRGMDEGMFISQDDMVDLEPI